MVFSRFHHAITNFLYSFARKFIHDTMEELLHYCWKHKLLPLGELHTTRGEQIEVIDTGLHNHHAGPDFFNAKIKVDGTLWIGNVEMHDKATDWYQHGHDKDSRYDNVVLHVVGKADGEVHTADGRRLPQLVLEVPAVVVANYQELLKTDTYPPCYRVIPDLSVLVLHAWMSALLTERLEQRTEAVKQRVAAANGSWEDAYFVTLARSFGFGINGDAFETWARSMPLQAVAHHRDELFQVEAFFLGQAGLLEEDTIPERYREQARTEGYFDRLQSEYRYLAHKFSLQPMDSRLWRFLRLRPQNFPHIRLAQLAHLYYQRKTGLAALTDCMTITEVQQLLCAKVTPYWQTHYTFGSASDKQAKRLSAASLNLLIINTVVPMLFAYGRYRGDEELCDRAFLFLEQMKAENNHITRMWSQCGISVKTAADSQALIQLKNNYCNRRDCLRCRIGYEYLKRV